MVYNIIKKLNNENLNDVMKEYNELFKKETSKNSSLTTSHKKQGLLFLKSIDNTISKISQEQHTHLQNTAKLAKIFANELNLTKSETETLILATRYHDIGKININKDILNKPGKLDDQEWEKIKMHPVHSYEILNSLDGLHDVANISLSHHERFDGSGYPNKLKGNEIPLLSRIISILDTYEVLTSGRVYRKAVSNEDAITEIKRCANTQFDPELVILFESFMSKDKEQEQSL